MSAKKKEEMVCPIPRGAVLKDGPTPVDMVYFCLKGGKYEGHIQIDKPASAECEVILTVTDNGDEPKRIGIGTYISNLFPFDPHTIETFLDMAISSTAKAMDNGTASIRKDGDRVIINPNLTPKDFIGDDKDDEDIRW